MGTSSPHAGKGCKPFQECPGELSSELRGRHVAVFQVKILQIAHVRQLVDDVLESFTV